MRAGGAEEGSQGQALGAPPLGYVMGTTALKGRKNSTCVGALSGRSSDFELVPGAARKAAYPWLPSAAPPALVECDPFDVWFCD